MLNWLRRKSARTSAQLAQMLGMGRASWMNRDYSDYAEEGYIKNIVAYHCVSRISQAVADIPFFIVKNGKEVEKDDTVKLLMRPNAMQSYKQWMRQAIMYRLISGNCYIFANTVSTGRVMELTNLRPDRVNIATDSFGDPLAYEYTINGRVYRYDIEPLSYRSDIVHLKEPHPLDDLYGLSPIAAAAMSIDQHNESGEWNKKLLENSARPPGILTVKSSDSLTGPDQKQLEQLSEKLQKYTGASNAGKIPIFSHELNWASMGMSPADMDWINGKSTSARDICLAFGYPAILLGMPEGATYNNVSEAKLALYEEIVIPLLNDTLEDLSHFISMRTKTDTKIVPDLDKVSALIPRREMARRSAREDMLAGLISPNEARLEAGYQPIEGGDDVLVPAGKLPLNFDMGALDEKRFQNWMKQEGFSESFIKDMSRN